MSKPIPTASVCAACLAEAAALRCATAVAQKPKAGAKPVADQPAAVVGVWESTDRHVALASPFQPEHGVRKRRAAVQFALAGERLTGNAVAEDSPDRKDGCTDFRRVTFADGRLVFE